MTTMMMMMMMAATVARTGKGFQFRSQDEHGGGVGVPVDMPVDVEGAAPSQANIGAEMRFPLGSAAKRVNSGMHQQCDKTT